MTKNIISNFESKEILLEDVGDYNYLIEDSEIFLGNKESGNDKKLFFCNKNFIGEVQSAENEILLKQIISDLVNFARIDNISISFLFVSEAIELFEYINSKFTNSEVSKNKTKSEVETDVKFYFAEESLNFYMNGKILDKTQLKQDKIELLNSREIASLLLISDVVTLT